MFSKTIITLFSLLFAASPLLAAAAPQQDDQNEFPPNTNAHNNNFVTESLLPRARRACAGDLVQPMDFDTCLDKVMKYEDLKLVEVFWQPNNSNSNNSNPALPPELRATFASELQMARRTCADILNKQEYVLCVEDVANATKQEKAKMIQEQQEQQANEKKTTTQLLRGKARED